MQIPTSWSWWIPAQNVIPTSCQRKHHTSEILSMARISDTVKPNKGQLLLVWCQIKQGCERQLRAEILTQLNALSDRNQQCSEWMLKDGQALKPLSHAACMASIILKDPLFCRRVFWQSQASYPSLHLLIVPSHSYKHSSLHLHWRPTALQLFGKKWWTKCRLLQEQM